MFLRLIFISIPSWLLFEAIHIPLIIFGWFSIPCFAILGLYIRRRSKYFDKEIYAWSFKWFDYIYGNEEDGILNGAQYRDMKDNDLQIIYWTALRNPTNNLRFVPILSCKINPAKVEFTGSYGSKPQSAPLYDKKYPHWFFAWCGLYSCLYWQFEWRGKLKRFWIGWAIYPNDINGVTPYRKPSAGFKVQLKDIKK